MSIIVQGIFAIVLIAAITVLAFFVDKHSYYDEYKDEE
jgi:hypothetical protein